METVRSALQPVTRSLPGPIRDLGTSIIGESCYEALILDIDLENTECVKPVSYTHLTLPTKA